MPGIPRRQSVTRLFLRGGPGVELAGRAISGVIPVPPRPSSTIHNGPDAEGCYAPVRLDGFGFDLPPHFGHCGSLFATPARTNAHPIPLLSVQTQIWHSVHRGHILTLFG